MTTITIERELLEQALEALEIATDNYDDSAIGIEVESIRAALAAPAHQEQLKPGECWPARIMKQWDEMRDLISKGDKSSLPRDWFESLAEMRLIDAPTTAWHDAPTVPGLWVCRQAITDNVQAYEVTDQMALNRNLKLKGQWYGPIPEDRQ